MTRRLASLLSVAVLFLTGCASLSPQPTGPLVLHVLAVNDIHGNLDAPNGGQPRPDPANPGKTITVPAGGLARMATLAKRLRARAPGDTIMVAAGDLVGASPLLSSLFHDEPTVESLSRMGLVLTSVGNHEFDEGPAELQRMQHGGCHPVDGCKGPHPFTGATYEYLAASTIDNATGKTIFPPYAIRTFEGVKVGFIGLTTVQTPDYVIPSGVAGVTFKDEAETINALVPELRRQGVEAIVVLIHEGGYPAEGDPNGCPVSGRITEILPKLDKAVDLVVSGHTHTAYVCTIGGRLVTSASSFGRMMTDITVTIDRKSHDVISASAQNLVVSPDIPEDPEQKAGIDAYRALAAPLMNRVVGTASATISAEPNDAGEDVLGDIVADAMKAAGARDTGQPVDLALMNQGGLRGQLVPKANGSVTYADLFSTQPFGNGLVAMDLTGADLLTILDQQFVDRPYLLQVSDGLTFAWRKTGENKGAMVPGSARLNGKPIDPAARYRVVTNSFLAEGADGYLAFKNGTNRTVGGGDIDAMEVWMKTHSPLALTPLNRIRLEP